MNSKILIAGGTGNLGGRIIRSLLIKGVEVHAIVRLNTPSDKIKALEEKGVKVFKVNMMDINEVSAVCAGASCVISALAGLGDVIIDMQKVLLDAAIAAGVPRFIPSDYSLDFTKFSDGENRNLDLRREFHSYLDKTNISATTIFNGAFADMLTDQIPMILFKPKLILYWGNADHKMAFTTMDNTADFTANAALDGNSPRYLHIAGDQISAREIKAALEQLTSNKFHLFRTGGKALLSTIIKIARKISPSENELYPAWQGMQYMRNMIDERSNLSSTDNDRYPNMVWTSVKDLLTAHVKNLKQHQNIEI